ncbi:hypothetical protein RB653_007826 [Dictyostelium firmibasis]|uniref:Uncharacterized protein n=1 Tax=Dictyostelium firmibasis TaxID=79012 RepID=A0AAN7YV05_9MYCE
MMVENLKRYLLSLKGLMNLLKIEEKLLNTYQVAKLFDQCPNRNIFDKGLKFFHTFFFLPLSDHRRYQHYFEFGN